MKISKRKSPNSFLSFDDVLNDINDKLAEKNGENYEIGDNFDQLRGKEEEIDSNPSEECLEEEQQSEEPEDNVNQQQRYRSSKQLTCSLNVHDIDSSLDEKNYKEIVYMNKNGVLEKLCGYLGPKKNKNPNNIWWGSEHPVATGRQLKCGTTSGKISRLTPNSRAKNIEKIEYTLHLYFDNDIMDKRADCTKTRINETMARLQRSDNFHEPSKYTRAKKTDRVEIDALFGLMYFRRILGVNLHITDRLFSNDSHFSFGAIMSKIHFRFLKDQICFDNPQETTQLWEADRFAAIREIWRIFNSNLSKHVAPTENLSIDEIFYPMRPPTAFRQYNPDKPHRFGSLLKSLNDVRFPYTYKAVPYAANPKVGDGPYYWKSNIDYIKYLITEMKADQPITGRTISTGRLYTSIE